MSRPVSPVNARLAAELCTMFASWIGSAKEGETFGDFLPPTHKSKTANVLAQRAIDQVSLVTERPFDAETAAEAASWILCGWRHPGDELQFEGPDAPVYLYQDGVRVGLLTAADEHANAAASEVEYAAALEGPTTYEDECPAEPFEPEVYDFDPCDLDAPTGSEG